MPLRRSRFLFTMLLAFALGAKILLLCDSAFAAPIGPEIASHCEMTGDATPSQPTKQRFNPICMVGCPAIVMRSGDVSKPVTSHVARLGIPIVDDLDGLHVPPAIPPTRPG